MLYRFHEPLGIASSYQAEPCVVMRAIEVAYQMNWNNFWLEIDLTLVGRYAGNPCCILILIHLLIYFGLNSTYLPPFC
jgi:hypothetical protein